jgi:hypothetical protein
LRMGRNRLFLWMASADNVGRLHFWPASKRDASDSTKRERLGSKLPFKLGNFLLFQEL